MEVTSSKDGNPTPCMVNGYVLDGRDELERFEGAPQTSRVIGHCHRQSDSGNTDIYLLIRI